MKSKISAKLIVMVMCAFILIGSIGLYAGLFDGVWDKCDRYCSREYDGGDKTSLYMACMNGCLFGAED